MVICVAITAFQNITYVVNVSRNLNEHPTKTMRVEIEQTVTTNLYGNKTEQFSELELKIKPVLQLPQLYIAVSITNLSGEKSFAPTMSKLFFLQTTT